MMNKKLERLKRELLRAQGALESYQQQLQERESDTDFQAAQAAFEAGARVSCWGAVLTDTFEEIYVLRPDGEYMYFADGCNRSTHMAQEFLGLTDDQIYHLSAICEEAGLWTRGQTPTWVEGY